MATLFYVSMIRAKRVVFLAGPFSEHEQAIDCVEPARKLANEIDPWTHFDLFGTCSTKDPRHGVLNSRLGLFTHHVPEEA